jgi:hypothetical protein
VRRLAAPLLAQALGKVPDLVSLVLARNQELEARGYHAQVLVEESSSLLFALDGARRVPLRINDGVAPAGLKAEDLSPNALLRPVVQDYMMPTVATVMGPAEVAYMAQAEVLYRALLGRMPVVVPRACFTLADARSGKLMDRYGLVGGSGAGEAVRRDCAAARSGVAGAAAGGGKGGDRGAWNGAKRPGEFDPSRPRRWTGQRKILYQFGGWAQVGRRR